MNALVEADRDDAAQVFTLRQTYWRNGYRPVPVYTRQKRPRGNGWLADALQNPPVGATRWPEIVALRPDWQPARSPASTSTC